MRGDDIKGTDIAHVSADLRRKYGRAIVRNHVIILTNGTEIRESDRDSGVGRGWSDGLNHV